MKLCPISFSAALGSALLLAACDRGAQQSEAQRIAEERAALEREKAQLAAEKIAAQQNANEQERARIEAERGALDREKAQLAANREAEAAAQRDAKIAAEREQRMTAERRAAEQTAARREAEEREREAKLAAENAAQEARATQTIDFFYEALDPHGDWVEVDRYGYAFRPRASLDSRWRPYTDGGWVYTDYGWTWRSNEPFGWATYHYGRWARLPRVGWVWIPGSEWGPAWVSWRRSDDYVGWAPLPPDAWSSSGFNPAVDLYFDIGPGLYVFLRTADFGEPTYIGRVVEPEKNVTIINHTVNVTNVVYKKVQNDVTVVNEGPDITEINRVARNPVQKLAVQRIESGAIKSAKVQDGVLQVAAPKLKGEPTTAKPKQIKENAKGKKPDLGWNQPKGAVDQFRTEAKKQARQAELAAQKPQLAPTTPLPPPPVPPATTPVPREVKEEKPEGKPLPSATPAVKPPAEKKPRTKAKPPEAAPTDAEPKKQKLRIEKLDQSTFPKKPSAPPNDGGAPLIRETPRTPERPTIQRPDRPERPGKERTGGLDQNRLSPSQPQPADEEPKLKEFKKPKSEPAPQTSLDGTVPDNSAKKSDRAPE
jgi:hypothetical protein